MSPEDFTIDTSAPDRAVLEGVLRLASPTAYEERFGPIRDRLKACEGEYTIDITRVRFVNSSGITGLSRLVLLSRSLDRGLIVIGKETIGWQETTLRLFQRLYQRLDVRLVR